MPTLDFEDSRAKAPATKKPLTLFLGTGVLVGALALGSTFAANINLNGNSDVEFGQGVVTTTACDDDGITVTPYSTYINAPGTGEHKLSSIRISGVNSTACDGKTFRIKAYGSGPDPLDLFNYTRTDYFPTREVQNVDYNFVDIEKDGSDFLWRSGGSDGDDVIDKSPTAFTIDLISAGPTITRTLGALATGVKKITVETFDTSATERGYNVSEIGPGGGTIFYVANEPFDCGPTLNEVCQYLEVAPDSWDDSFDYADGDPGRTWSSFSNRQIPVAGANATAIGTGYSNSIAIRSQLGNNNGNSAAVLAREYLGGGKTDWYLPSKDELNRLHIFNFFEGEVGYWSSSEYSNGQAWYYERLNGAFTSSKAAPIPVRPIRAF